jgi:GR25 family glycosyltransferase involved in LPS biosynthesis
MEADWYTSLYLIYINLDCRKDRRVHIINELNKLDINQECNRHRLSALRATNNEHKALGCTKSHIAAINIAIENNWPYVFICEDDITFNNPELFKTQLFAFLEEGHKWDCILVAGNNFPPYSVLPSGTAVSISKCQTTTGYIVRNSYYTTLKNNFLESHDLLKKNKNKYSKYAIDKWWFSLQSHGTWFLIIPLSVVQQAGYSDILCKKTDYIKDMLQLQ